MKEGLGLEQAPATFQDVILVTHLLGINHLLADSLCSIQGDNSD